MVRLSSIALVVLLLPALAAAQSGRQAHGAKTPAPPSAPAPARSSLGPIGLPLPPIGLPLPPLGLSAPQPTPRPGHHGRPDGKRGHGGRKGRKHDRSPAIIVFGAPYAFGTEVYSAPAPGMTVTDPGIADAEPAGTGWLRLEIGPATSAQLFVDGEFIGTTEDVGLELQLQPGTRRLEIRAPGYEAVPVDVRIVEGRTITFRATLTPIAPPPAAAPPPDAKAQSPDAKAPTPVPAERQTFYLIPGCYLGNVPPQQVRLPADCDLSRLITRTP